MSEKNCKDCADPDCCAAGMDETTAIDKCFKPKFKVGWKVKVAPYDQTWKGRLGIITAPWQNLGWLVRLDSGQMPWFEERHLECDHQWRNISNMPIYDPRVQCCQCGEVRGPGESFEVEVEAKDPKDKPQAKLLGQALNFIIHDEFAADYDYSKLRGMESIYTLDKEKDMDRMEVEAPKTVLEKKALKEAKELAIQNATGTKKQEYFDAVNRFIGLERKAREVRALADELKKSLGLTKAEIDELI